MADLRQKTCCFTGHRAIPEKDLPGILERTEQIVRELIERGVMFFGVGGAIGYDTEVAKLLFRLRTKDYPQIKIILVYPFDGFTGHWGAKNQTEYARLFPQYNKVTCVAANASKDAYLIRDRHLVDCSAYCICYCTRGTGGTAYTVKYAIENGLDVYNTAEFDVKEM